MSDNMSKSIIMFENVEEFSLISFFGVISFFADVDTCLFLGSDSVLLSAVCRFPLNLRFLKHRELPVDLRLPASNFCFFIFIHLLYLFFYFSKNIVKINIAMSIS